MSNLVIEESIYNPYNEKNKEITMFTVKQILNTFNVYYDCYL